MVKILAHSDNFDPAAIMHIQENVSIVAIPFLFAFFIFSIFYYILYFNVVFYFNNISYI